MTLLNILLRYINTVRFLRFTQIAHQLKYKTVFPKRKSQTNGQRLKLPPLTEYPVKPVLLGYNGQSLAFRFLNKTKTFDRQEIDWTYSQFGLLWTYNLNYLDWLHQEGMTKEKGLESLLSFYQKVDYNPIALHPYPTSLRVVNTVKFASKWQVQEAWLHDQIVADLNLLMKRLEYHLLANHLLENAFALYIGGLTTAEENALNYGKKLLAEQLQEQILNDGMHYERSPMYHLIILERLLDSLNMARAHEDEMVGLLTTYAAKMTSLALNWRSLDRIPMMQDSTNDVAPNLDDILSYARRLLAGFFPRTPCGLGQSKYRIITAGPLTLFANVGSVAPSYQPAHAHADELNFELYLNGKPVITDVGVSTYEKNQRRQLERSTESHNCVSWGGNSSDVWSGFRVGRRAQVDLMLDTDSKILAKHDGHNQGVVTRSYQALGDNSIVIVDSIRPKEHMNAPAIGRLHLHPEVRIVELTDQEVLLNNGLKITFNSTKPMRNNTRLGTYKYAQGYNKLATAVVICYDVAAELKIQFLKAS